MFEFLDYKFSTEVHHKYTGWYKDSEYPKQGIF